MSSRRIQVLPEHLANKIAAGEVIQRPESVVKELLENSLDASAKNIVVIVEEGGKKLIQIVDDGIGMDEVDAVNSFLRHSTSKIATYDDLEEIRTYGFRGEALASIAAVGQVVMKTRRSQEDAATVVQIDGGSEPRVSKEGREPGTSISVQNLFFNVPARRKFLKSDNTEFRHIYDVVQRVAISHPEIAVRYISDGETVIDVKAGTLQDRMLDIFGERQFNGMVWLEERGETLSVYGYIGKPAFGQKSRVNQYLFLNGRFIISRQINHAVFSAYEHLLLKSTFPFFLLFIDIDPKRVDVNVHPSKMEAKFDDEQNIYRFVSTLVQKCLSTHDLVPAASMSEAGSGNIGLNFTDRQHTPFQRGSMAFDQQRSFVDPATGEITVPKEGTQFAARLLGSSETFEQLLQTELPHQDSERPEPGTAAFVWQLHNKYILMPIRNGLMIVDQHVAHERILYERAVIRFEHNMQSAQQLLFPFTVQLSPGDYSLLTELHAYFHDLGFEIKLFGGNTIVIEGAPPDVKAGNEVRIVEDLLAVYKEHNQHSDIDSRDALAKMYSCKAAVKAGDSLTEQEMRSLLDQLFATKIPYVCPHGRPIVLKISIDELDRRFGRT